MKKWRKENESQNHTHTQCTHTHTHKQTHTLTHIPRRRHDQKLYFTSTDYYPESIAGTHFIMGTSKIRPRLGCS